MSSQNEEFIAFLMHTLSIDNTDVADILADCNNFLNEISRSDLFKSANLIDLNLIFDCLNTTDREQIEMTCELLQKLLSVLSPNIIFSNYSVSIESSLHHPYKVVKCKILSQLGKILAKDNNVDIQVNLACTIIDCLTNKDTSVSYHAVKCLKEFKSIETISSLPILYKLQSLVEINGNIRSRLYEILIHWAKSVGALALISSKGLFCNLASDITSPDVMMQMETIQMLIPLGVTEHGFDYLNSVGIISGLYRLLSFNLKELNDPLAVIPIPVVLVFFINVSQARPQLIFTTYPKVLVVIYEILKDGDGPQVGVVINAIDFLASSWERKTALDIPIAGTTFGFQDDEKLDIWSILIKELGHIASSTKTDLRAGAIQAITSIIQVENGELSSKNDMIARTQKWYKQMSNNPIKNIVHASCILPFADIQQAGFEMLLALAEQLWGHEEINAFPSLLDLVFENCPTDSLIIKDLKKTIIKVLLESSEGIFNKELTLRVKNNTALKTDNNPSQSEVLVEDVTM